MGTSWPHPPVSSNLLYAIWCALAGLGVYLLYVYAPGHPPPSPPAVTVTINQIAPDIQAHFSAPAGRSVDVKFTWETVSPEILAAIPVARRKLYLDVSRDFGFASALTSVREITPLTATEIKLPLAPDHYYWRLRLGNAVFSDSRDLWIDAEKAVSAPEHYVAKKVERPIALQVPPDRQEFMEQPKTPLEFAWRGRDISGKEGWAYQVEVAYDFGFQRVVGSLHQTSGFQVRAKVHLPPGIYFWHVKLLNRRQVVEVSEYSRFVIKARPLLMAPPSNVTVEKEGR